MTSGQEVNRTLAFIIFVLYIAVLGVVAAQSVREQRLALRRQRPSGSPLTRMRRRHAR